MGNDNIPGIYNYCDRWCERCIYTSRCAVFESEKDALPDEQDMANKAFWERLSDNFAKAKEMLEKKAEELGIDLTETETEAEAYEKRKAEVKIKSQNNPIIKLAREYGLFTRKWLKTQPGMMAKLERLKEEITMGVESQEGVRTQTETIKDCLAVIQWYNTFIEVKFMRALSGKIQNSFPDEDFPRDYDGSAKIGIIAIERSMQAWARLFDLLPDQEDDFLRALSLLEKIKSAALAEFPEAMNFVRPGFDE
jgi:hypothetical protein